MPDNCEIKTITIFNDIFMAPILGNTNRWLYILHELIELIVSGQDEAKNIEINKAGILSIKQNCKPFTKNTVILAKYEGKSNFSTDFVRQFQLSRLTKHLNNKIKKQNTEDENQLSINTVVKLNDIKLYAKSMSA